MEDLLFGIEKFGLGSLKELELYREKEDEVIVQTPKHLKEFKIQDVTYEKGYTCGVCENKFNSRTMRSGKMRSVAIDYDLRPIYEEPIHPIFYDIVICPKCGHTAISQTFSKVRSYQHELILNKITPTFKYVEYPAQLNVDMAIERYKLALVNAIIKHVRDSEKAYICMKLAWLYRSKKDKNNELKFIENAYNGYSSAYDNESFPLLGLEENTVLFLIASYAKTLGLLSEASKIISKLILSKTISQRLKDRVMDLKQDIMFDIRARDKK